MGLSFKRDVKWTFHQETQIDRQCISLFQSLVSPTGALNKLLFVSEATLHMNTWLQAGGHRDKHRATWISHIYILLTTLSLSSTSAGRLTCCWELSFSQKCSCISQGASRGQAQSPVSSLLSAEWRRVIFFSRKQQLETEWQTVSQRVWEDRTGLSSHVNVCLWCAIFSRLWEHVPEVLECEFIIRQELVAGSELAGFVSWFSRLSAVLVC